MTLILTPDIRQSFFGDLVGTWTIEEIKIADILSLVQNDSQKALHMIAYSPVFTKSIQETGMELATALGAKNVTMIHVDALNLWEDDILIVMLGCECKNPLHIRYYKWTHKV